MLSIQLQNMTSQSLIDAIACFDQGKFSSARCLFEDLLSKSITQEEKDFYMFNISSCRASEGDYDEASQYMNKLSQESTANDNLFLYNKALCHYRSHRFNEAIEILDDLIDTCLGDNSRMNEVIDEASYSSELQESCFIQAINLRAAASYKKSRNRVEANEYLEKYLQFKDQSDYDCITLHNNAIYDCAKNPVQSMNKLMHLLDTRQEPATNIPELYQNILVLYLTFFNQSDASSEFFKKHGDDLARTIAPSETIKYLEIQLERKHSSDEVHYEHLAKLMDQLLDKLDHLHRSSPKYHSLLDLIKTVVDNQAIILWQQNQYRTLERLLLKTKQALQIKDKPRDDHYSEIWHKNMAHVLYLSDTRFKECVQIYETFLPRGDDESLLGTDPAVLANLCVAYVLTGRNGDAEHLIKEVEDEENEFPEFNYDNEDLNGSSRVNLSGDDECSHLRQMNLSIETLYCVKGNYEFGLSRMFKTMEPLKERLNSVSWYHAKRCILALLMQCSCQILSVNDDLFDQIIRFLINCERIGQNMPATNLQFQQQSKQTISPRKLEANSSPRPAVAHEARYLRALCLTIVHD